MTEPGETSQRLDAETRSDGTQFRLGVYEGPLDLLLHLIKRNELDPRDVTASIITEQYLAHLELLDSLNLEVAGEYLVMAATLLLIKSFALLPHQENAEAEDAEELKRDLIARLLEYQRYREAGAKLGERPILGRDVFGAPGVQPADPAAGGAPIRVSPFELIEALRAVLRRIGDRAPRQITLRDIPVASRIAILVEAIRAREKIEFAALFEGLWDRPLVIATFLALLELIRRRQARAWQDERGGPIWIGRGAAQG